MLFRPTALKLSLALGLLIIGGAWGLSTFGPFEGSVREGPVSAMTVFERQVVRPLSFMGPAVELDKRLSRSEALGAFSRFGTPAIAAAIAFLYYYAVTCLGLALVSRLRRAPKVEPDRRNS